jgi:hypothetical protein
LEEKRIEMQQDRLEEIRAGERIKRAADQSIRDAAEAETQRHHKMLERNKEYLRANVASRKIKEERAEMEALEIQKIQEFADERDRLWTMRKEAEARR